MSVETTRVWTCNYCGKSVTIKDTNYGPSGWIQGNLLWDEGGYRTTGRAMNFCGVCESELFLHKNQISAVVSQKNKPFWKKFFGGE